MTEKSEGQLKKRIANLDYIAYGEPSSPFWPPAEPKISDLKNVFDIIDSAKKDFQTLRLFVDKEYYLNNPNTPADEDIQEFLIKFEEWFGGSS